MKKALLLLAGVLTLGCGEMVEPSRAVRSMEAAGFTHVKVTGQHGIAPDLFGCSKGDAVAFDVMATNPSGAVTRATVCCGLVFKSCTIRY